MKTHAFIFARGGSKGLPNKNIRLFIDKPLLAHSIIIAKQIPEVDKCFVSTDSDEIATIAKNFGSIVIKRPSNLAQDDSPELLAWKHATQWVQNLLGDFDRFVSLPTTAPLRTAEDINKCLALFDNNVDLVVTMTNAQSNPWFNMVKLDSLGYVRLINKSDNRITRRQDAPKAYSMTTICYVTRPDFIMKTEYLWDARVKGVLIPEDRAVDIDTELDFKFAEFLMHERLNSF